MIGPPQINETKSQSDPRKALVVDQVVNWLVHCHIVPAANQIDVLLGSHRCGYCMHLQSRKSFVGLDRLGHVNASIANIQINTCTIYIYINTKKIEHKIE